MGSWTSMALSALVWIPSAQARAKVQGTAAEAKPAAGSRAERFAALQKEWDDARREFSKAYQAAKTPEEREKLSYPEPKTWAPRIWELVREDPRDETALEALAWIV